MRKAPKISLIMPNLNGESFLNSSIQSFLDQKYEFKELIIVDGKSTDGSHIIIEKFANENAEIRWIKDIDLGLCHAFNIGLKYSEGDVVGILPNDDCLSPNIFDLVSHYYVYTNFDGIYFHSYNFFENTGKIKLRKCPNVEFNKFNLLLYGSLVGFENLYYTRKVYQKYNWNVSNRFSPDLEFYLRVANENYSYLLIDVASTVNVIHEKSLGSKNKVKQLEEVISLTLLYVKDLNYISGIMIYLRVILMIIYLQYLKLNR